MLLFLLLAMWLRMAQTLCLSIKFRESLRSSCLWEKKRLPYHFFLVQPISMVHTTIFG